MGIFDGILICTDLDGTLYRDDKTISRENREAIEYFKREGGLFTFITGRMPYYATDAYEAVCPNAPFGAGNGGALFDGEKGDYAWTAEPLPQSVGELIEAVVAEIPEIGVQYASHSQSYFARENEMMFYFRAVTGVPNITCEIGHCPVPIAKILFGGESELMEGAERILRAHPRASEFDFIRSEERLFEILPKGISKGVAIEKLCECLGIARKNSIAIGDYNNDVPMLRAAGLGVAVSNACKEALAEADLVTVSNEEHALARIIYDLRDGKIKL